MSQVIRPPDQMTRRSFRGKITFQDFRGKIVAKAWPRKRGPNGTPAQLVARAEFAAFVGAIKGMQVGDKVAAIEIAKGCAYTWRDVLSLALVGKLVEIQGAPMAEPKYFFDQLTDVVGAMIIRTDQGWVGLLPGDPDQVLVIVDGLPTWQDVDIPDPGITELTGDVSAGPGSGSQVATLNGTGVTPGSYTRASLTVNTDGRLTAASSGASDAGITQLTGDVTAGPGDGSQATTLATSGVSPGSYTATNLTVDAKGRITAASNGSGFTGSGNGLFASLMSVLPTIIGTGFSTWLNQGSATVVDNASGMTIASPTAGAANAMHARTQAVPGTPYTRTALIMVQGAPANFLDGGIGWYDGSGKRQTIRLVWNGGWAVAVTDWSSATAIVTNHYLSASGFMPQLWLQITDDGTNVTFSWSIDGATWVQAYTVAKSAGYLGSSGYSNLLFYTNPNGGANSTTLLSWQ